MKLQISDQTAEILVADQSTSARILAEIAAQHAPLRDRIRQHPNVYPDLIDWMDEVARRETSGDDAESEPSVPEYQGPSDTGAKPAAVPPRRPHAANAGARAAADGPEA
ncbi:hypothetical protein, partial [Leucobacter chromiiresistens]